MNWPTESLPTILISALCEIRDDLATYRLFETLGREWASSLCGTIDGMQAEYQWRLGYRKGAKGGTWIARFRGDDGHQHYDSLGAADDAREPNDIDVFDFAHAQKRARDWFDLPDPRS